MNTPGNNNGEAAARRRHWASRTHRVFGISAALFLLLIALSGLVLNHADTLGLSRFAAGPAMLRLYGVELPPVDAAFEAGGVLFATSSGSLFANGMEVTRSSAVLVGAVAVGDRLVLATATEIFITTRQAELIERFPPEFGITIARLGSDGRHIVIATADNWFTLDPERMTLGKIEATADIAWSEPAVLSSAQRDAVALAALGNAINWERVLLDLHSGRILPGVGRYLADLAALCLVYLCISGIVLWFRRRQPRY